MERPHVLVFAYEFRHRKTYDFIVDLIALGIKIVVIAAPHRELVGTDRTQYFSRSLKFPEPLLAKDLCATLGIDIHYCDHRDADKIGQIVKAYSSTLGVIAGARIIPNSVIKLFSEGVVNFHPGKIPETSGLDSLYYTIRHMVPAGITCHFIDAKVDAGAHIFFEELEISLYETLETLTENIYQLQRSALRKFILWYNLGNLTTEKIHRPLKNAPMGAEEKRKVLDRFKEWQLHIFLLQQQRKLFDACIAGHVDQVNDILMRSPSLLELVNNKGWTPLIVASFNQRLDVVRVLLGLGADPNRGGAKGTTPLMYAKTKLLNDPSASYELLDILIQSGADPARRDSLGRDVESYVAESGDMRLLEKIKGHFKN